MRIRCSLSVLLLSGMSLAVQAAVPPDAGQSLRNLEQAPLQLPSKQTLEINLPDSAAAPAAGGSSLSVNGFRLEGNSAIASEELLALLDDLQGRSVSVGELQGGAYRITQYYRERGYPLARAYLPAQEIADGMVQIAVLEGRLGHVKIDNNAGVRGVALAPLAALKTGEAVQADALERSLLLLNDTPGIEVKSTLTPGASVGATDLLVDVQPGKRLDGSVELDNFGNRYTGEYRLGGHLNFNSPLGLGDRLSLRAMGSDEQQHYYRLGYQLPVGPWATQVGIAYSDMDYQLSKDFDELDAHGNARISSIYVLQPLLRSRALSLSAQVQFDDKRLKDDIDLFSQKADKRSRVVIASLTGNSQDTLFGGGVNAFSLAFSRGGLTIDGAQNKLIDDVSAGTRGRFHKLNASAVRLQRLTDRLSLYGQLQGQWANDNLDSSEKFSLGGAYGVRAYPQGEASGDQGWLANLELRYALTSDWQVFSFVDHGQARLNKDNWSGDANHRSLSGAGLGARWSAGGWQLNTVTAWKLGNADAQSDVERSPRVWAQLVRNF